MMMSLDGGRVVINGTISEAALSGDRSFRYFVRLPNFSHPFISAYRHLGSQPKEEKSRFVARPDDVGGVDSCAGGETTASIDPGWLARDGH